MKNTKDKAMKALTRSVGKALSAPKRAYYASKDRQAEKTYQAYKMVNEADKAGIKDKGNASDPLFRARASMRAAQRKALERKI